VIGGEDGKIKCIPVVLGYIQGLEFRRKHLLARTER
jgi:hypothetical protein